MHRWIWYALAVACMVVAFNLVHIVTWQYFVAVFLYTFAGALVWEHVRPRPPTLTVEHLREIDKEYR